MLFRSETFRIAEIAVAAYIVLFVSRAEKASTVMGALIVAELTTLLVGVGFSASFQELALGILVIALTSTYGRELKVAAKI